MRRRRRCGLVFRSRHLAPVGLLEVPGIRSRLSDRRILSIHDAVRAQKLFEPENAGAQLVDKIAISCPSADDTGQQDACNAGPQEHRQDQNGKHFT